MKRSGWSNREWLVPGLPADGHGRNRGRLGQDGQLLRQDRHQHLEQGPGASHRQPEMQAMAQGKGE